MRSLNHFTASEFPSIHIGLLRSYPPPRLFICFQSPCMIQYLSGFAKIGWYCVSRIEARGRLLCHLAWLQLHFCTFHLAVLLYNSNSRNWWNCNNLLACQLFSFASKSILAYSYIYPSWFQSVKHVNIWEAIMQCTLHLIEGPGPVLERRWNRIFLSNASWEKFGRGRMQMQGRQEL